MTEPQPRRDRDVRAPSNPPLPDYIETEDELDELMSRPDSALEDWARRLEGDLMILGIAGKMGATVGRMARRALDAAGLDTRVIGVSRFSTEGSREALESVGVETIACNLLDANAVSSLPDAPNIIYMAGRKFGTTGAEELTWASNAVIPTRVADRFSRSRIVVYSTGCVYAMEPTVSGGSTEDSRLNPPGEYAWSTVGRERVFSYFSRTNGTPMCMFRLNYAIDLRYGVLHDIARAVASGRPVPLDSGHVNVIWQGDAARYSLLALELCGSPPALLNATGPETLSVRKLATMLAAHLGVEATFSGSEAPTVWLSDAGKAHGLFGYPIVPLSYLIRWTAHWVSSGGRSLGKPTHFAERGGTF